MKASMEQALAARDEAIPYSKAILEQPALQQALAQIRSSGREKQVARVLDAVAVGAEEGFRVGSAVGSMDGSPDGASDGTSVG